LPPSGLTGPVRAHGLRQPGGGRCAGALTAARPPRASIPARIPGRANVAAGTSAADSPTLAHGRPVRCRSAELRLDPSASSWRSTSPGSGGHRYWPRPFDASPARPSAQALMAQALMTVIAAADRGCPAASLFRSGLLSTESLPDPGLAGTNLQVTKRSTASSCGDRQADPLGLHPGLRPATGMTCGARRVGDGYRAHAPELHARHRRTSAPQAHS
jgi:hypothetical protein